MKKKDTTYYNDLDLIRQYYNEKDDYWLGELLNKYLHLIFGVCMKYLKNENEAQEHTQQLCLEIIQIFHKKRQKINNFKAWLFQVTKNHCLMHLRKKTHQTISLEQVEHPTAHKPIPQSEFDKKEQQYQLLEKAMASLKGDQKKCIDLFYYKKKTYKEISAEQGYSLKEVKSFIQNGRRNMKVFMERNENESL